MLYFNLGLILKVFVYAADNIVFNDYTISDSLCKWSLFMPIAHYFGIRRTQSIVYSAIILARYDLSICRYCTSYTDPLIAMTCRTNRSTSSLSIEVVVSVSRTCKFNRIKVHSESMHLAFENRSYMFAMPIAAY